MKFSPSFLLIAMVFAIPPTVHPNALHAQEARQRLSSNDGWTFFKYTTDPDSLVYDERPLVTNSNDSKAADSKPTETGLAKSSDKVLKKWILPTANNFINEPAKQYQRPTGSPGKDFPFVQNDFNDNTWERINLPHDWAIKGPFYAGDNSVVGGGMGHLPSQGVACYRKKLDIKDADKGKTIYLDIDGAMSYAMVWLNGNLVGGRPYGYNSFRLDLTPYATFGGDNQLAIRVDNPNYSARWYPGAAIYRNVWLTKVNHVHVAQWGTFISSRNVSASSANVHLSVDVENKSATNKNIEVLTEVFALGRLRKLKRIREGFDSQDTLIEVLQLCLACSYLKPDIVLLPG